MNIPELFRLSDKNVPALGFVSPIICLLQVNKPPSLHNQWGEIAWVRTGFM